MKNKLIFGLAVLLLFTPGMTRADAPHQVGGFALGQNIEAYKDRVIMDTTLPVRYSENMEEVEIKFTQGFKSGLITYGTCAKPGQIVKIKLKYADSSKEFHKNLFKQFEKRFGEPDEYRGDPFGIVKAWKWSFVDKNNNRISLVLQHNTRDEDESIGNSVKLAMWNLIEDERECFEKKKAAETKKTKKKKQGKADWEVLIPH